MVQTPNIPQPTPEQSLPARTNAGKTGWTFSKFATDIATWTGHSKAFGLACVGVVLWGLLGPHFHYSDTWQLVINTTTTIITFLMVFLIQNTQNRDTRAINLKLDEIIRSHKRAHNELIDIEKLSDAELEELAQHFERIRAAADERAERKGPRSEDHKPAA